MRNKYLPIRALKRIRHEDVFSLEVGHETIYIRASFVSSLLAGNIPLNRYLPLGKEFLFSRYMYGVLSGGTFGSSFKASSN